MCSSLKNDPKYDRYTLSSHCKIVLCINDMNFDITFLDIGSKNQTEICGLKQQLAHWLLSAWPLFVSHTSALKSTSIFSWLREILVQILSYFQPLNADGSKTCYYGPFKSDLEISNLEKDLHFRLLSPLTCVFWPLKFFRIHFPCSESHEEVKILIVTRKLNSKTWLHWSGDKRARGCWMRWKSSS